MFRVRQDLCVGCGRCADGCPQQAISIVNGKTRINQALCTGCGLCRGLCPQGAIVELAAVSREKLTNTVDSLKHKTDDLIKRIEKLQQKRSVVKESKRA